MTVANFNSITGEDPLDPESKTNGFRNGNPFANFQHFQHGSPFQFKFHFS